MLTVTEAASARLAEMLKQQDVPADIAVRFVHEGEGVGLRPDNEREGDTAFQHEGRTVLLLDAQVSELLVDDTLDVEDAKLTLRHPKEGDSRQQ